MKAIFIFKDGKLIGNPIGYTTIKGAQKSLIGSDDWYEQIKDYQSNRKEEELTEEEKTSGIWKKATFNDNLWLFQREVWSRKIWNQFVKEHYKFIEKEFDIVFKDDEVL